MKGFLHNPVSGLRRGNTLAGTKKSTASSKSGGHGWGFGRKEKEVKTELMRESDGESASSPPLYQPERIPSSESLVRQNSRSSQGSQSIVATRPSYDRQYSEGSLERRDTVESRDTARTEDSKFTQGTSSNRLSAPRPRPPLMASNSTRTLVGSALERRIQGDVGIDQDKIVDTTERLANLRVEMEKVDVDYYIVPPEDAHGSEYVAAGDKRLEFITGFTGSNGGAIITRESAYLVIDSRYWTQAEHQADKNRPSVCTGRSQKIGIDARMISHEKAAMIDSKLMNLNSKFVFPPQNLINLVWRDKPSKPRGVVYVLGIEYTGKDASYKLYKLREWIKALNLRGIDIPFSPLFYAYLYIGLDKPILFLDSSQADDAVTSYLEKMNVERRSYTDLWPFLRKREWGEGKLLIPPSTSYAISLRLTHFRYTLAPNRVEYVMALKNETELEGLRRAYIRDGVAFVQFLAWLDNKLNSGYDITEWEAAWRIKEFRMKQKRFMGLAYETISASGPNAAIPHYVPKKHSARKIDRDTPYLNDSGGQYRDGTCDTTRTVHFGRPTPDQSEAYTRVLQGHIAIDSAVFPEGTSGYQLDVLARKALWKDGLNYMHGTGHGVGSFLTLHEGDHGFNSSVPLMPGHVITNEPGFYLKDKWGVRIESALIVKRIQMKHEFNGNIWLGFERLTHVHIQTRMVKESMLTKEERSWLKEHNQICWDILSPYLKDDKVALKWLRREADRGIGI
ncbi:putative Xaa-Pro aminopeptidase P [Leucoagaricus sp. SymC.cos]|nr:putative Xaa-Pro aminopeptidase P [Leucoagaricus sp. SymC.cos]